MKKASVFAILTLLLVALPICGLAADHCPNHPSASLVFDCDDSWIPYSVTKHMIRYEMWLCSVCHKKVEEKADFDEHYFSSANGGICVKCGYERPTKEDLKKEASNLIYLDNIVNHGCWVMYKGTLYSSASSSSYNLGALEFGEGYYVNAYQQVGNNIWIQIKKLPSEEPIGWVQANILSIDQKGPQEPTGYEIGRMIRITTSSGRGRADAGTEFPYLETVHYGERYTVLDAKIGTNGNTWYEIRVDGRLVWISSGLATFD